MVDETIWQDELDQERLKALQPYRVVDSGKTVAQVFAEVNQNFYACYGPDFRTNPAPSKLLAEPAIAYEILLDELLTIDRIQFLPHRELINVEPSDQKIVCNIRHDVDGDIVAALGQAKMETDRGIRTTYFILHTAPYYGAFGGEEFLRNDAMRDVYLEIQNLGHEVALHTDPMLVYQSYGMDGAAALVEELAWLRAGGLDIAGSVAHNSNTVYGANNYAIFKGHWCTDRVPPGPRGVIFNNKWSPLQILDEEQLGLTYEGNGISWRTDVRVEQLTLYSQNFWFASSARPSRRRDPDTGPVRQVSTTNFGNADVAAYIHGIDAGCFLFLHIHPLIYGLRSDATSGPVRCHRQSTAEENRQIGWITCRPFSIEAEYADKADHQRFQSVNMSNEFGFLDRPLNWTPSEARDSKVLFIGRDNLHARTINLEAQLHSLVMEARHWQGENTFRSWKMAAPGMGFTRALGWLDLAREEIRPDYVVLGIGADEIEVCDPAHWQALTGYDPADPPGAYVWVGKHARAMVVDASSKTGAPHQAPAVGSRGRHSLTMADAGLADQTTFMLALNGLRASLQYVLDRIAEMGAQAVLLIEECGETRGMWSARASHNERLQAHANFLSYLPAWLPSEDMLIVDPYPRFLELDNAGLPTHWDSVPEWNERAHLVAAALIREKLGGSSKRQIWSQ